MLLVNQRQRLFADIASQTMEGAVQQRRRLHFVDPAPPQKALSAEGITRRAALPPATDPPVSRLATPQLPPATLADIDPLYLFGCFLEWEERQEPSAAWELLSAADSSNADLRAQARALLGSSRHFNGSNPHAKPKSDPTVQQDSVAEIAMKAPYGLEPIENCTGCRSRNSEFFCGCSNSVLKSLDEFGHKSTLPPGAILFVEGQTPRGVFIVCSGRVNLSTTSREGKILILKTAYAGEALGVSATVSGVGYETTAETATPCQLTFIDRKRFVEILGTYSEVGVHTAQCLSRDYQSAYHDIHDLVLTRSSAGKLARLLLSQPPVKNNEAEAHVMNGMTHEEMGQRIGASRETVTRLLSHLRKKRLIRLDGAALVIENRQGLEDLAF